MHRRINTQPRAVASSPSALQACARRSHAVPPARSRRTGPEDFSHLSTRISEHGTPVVDWLLETSEWAPSLTRENVAELRKRELKRRRMHPDDAVANLARCMRIAFANKGRSPWNNGVPHSEGTLLLLCVIRWRTASAASRRHACFEL